jgi:hypothetical protein
MAQKKLGEESRDLVLFYITETLRAHDLDALVTGSNKLGVPVVENGEESALEITVSIPKGSRDGTKYDPFEAAEAHRFREEEKRKKAEKKAEKKKE